MKTLLIDDYPIIVLPALAQKIGLNEAILLQQIHYWLNRSKTEAFGEKWVYNTYEDWEQQMPFLSARTIRRASDKLRKMGLVKTAKHITGNKFDHVTFYTIHYPAVEKLSLVQAKMDASNGGQTDLLEQANLAASYIDYNTETTQQTQLPSSDDDKDAKEKIPYLAIQALYNRICISMPSCRIMTDVRKKLVKRIWVYNKDHQDIEFWQWYFEKVEASNWLTGKDGKPKSFGFDWITNFTNFVKVIEGNYDNK